MYINNIHLKVLNYIQLKNNPTIESIACDFIYSPQVIRGYLNDILKHVSKEYNNKITVNDIITILKNEQGLKFKLKQHQILSKEEKIMYIFFSLLIFKNINLTEIGKTLDTTKRSLNYLLTELKSMENFRYLKIKSSSTGIKLIGTKRVTNHLKFYFTFKFLVERKNSHPLIRALFFNHLKNIDLKEVKFILKKLKSILQNESSYNSFNVLLASKGAFSSDNTNKKIKVLKDSELSKYKDKDLDYFTFFRIINLLRNSFLNEIETSYLCILISYIKRVYYIQNTYETKVIEECIKIKKIVAKYLNFKIINSKEFFNITSRIVTYAHLREAYSMDDLFALTSNLSIDKNSNIFKMTKEIQQICTCFTLYDGVTLYYKLTDEPNKRYYHYIFVYRNISDLVLNSIKNKIENIHNFKIESIVFYKNLENYLKVNHVDKIITVEELDLSKYNITHLTYSIH